MNRNNIGMIINWNKSVNNKVCLVLKICKVSHSDKFNFCKVLVGTKIHTVPKSNIISL